MHEACFINLPDVIPSIVFNISNATESLFTSGGYDIPNVSGLQLYSARSINARFGYEMYIVPALYSTSLRLFRVQQAALEKGRTLVIYEVFRPRATQIRVAEGLQALMRENNAIHTALNTPPWNPGMFIAHGVSLHQFSAAIDVSLARVVSYEIRTISGDGSQYRRITEIVYYEMPTQMHDLHPRAVSLVHPGALELAPGMTEGAILLRSLFTSEGFIPVASEWWHFSDMQGAAVGRAHSMRGEFFTDKILSFPPPQSSTSATASQPSPWAIMHVNAAYAAGLVPQNIRSNFSQAITRAEFAALAVYLYESQRSSIVGRISFADTNDENVQKAAYIGVVRGVGDNRFAPNDTLTREQAAVMLSRLAYAMGQPLPHSTPIFADNPQVAAWAIQAVGQMQASGIMGGVGNYMFSPQGDYTREQSIVTIMRLFENMKN